MNRSEAWAMFAASALTNEAELDIATAGHVADEMLQQFDARFRAQAGGPDLEDSAAARSGQVSVIDAVDQRETEQLIVDMLSHYDPRRGRARGICPAIDA